MQTTLLFCHVFLWCLFAYISVSVLHVLEEHLKTAIKGYSDCGCSCCLWCTIRSTTNNGCVTTYNVLFLLIYFFRAHMWQSSLVFCKVCLAALYTMQKQMTSGDVNKEAVNYLQRKGTDWLPINYSTDAREVTAIYQLYLGHLLVLSRRRR